MNIKKEPCMTRVIVHEIGDPSAIIHDKTNDHNETFFREWITNTTWWALRDGRKTVVITPL